MMGAGGPDSAVPGVDVNKVSQWITTHVEGTRAPFEFDVVSGGRSNLTFKVTDADGRRLVLRRPPMSHVLSTAHDMAREHRIITALGRTPVPVPPAHGLCQDDSVNGRPFYVMEFVEGHVLRGASAAEAALDEDGRRRAGEHLVDVLVSIHELDVDAVGLGDYGRRDGYIERQLRRWQAQFRQSQAQQREAGFGRPAPIVDEVHDLLAQRVPPQEGDEHRPRRLPARQHHRRRRRASEGGARLGALHAGRPAR
jgi:aminoglycoside phosphotransferase (APT) family kinase protein